MGLVAGVLTVNAVLLAAGYCLLSPALTGQSVRIWASYAGVALLAGVALVALAVFIAASLGATSGPATFAGAAALLAAAGLAAGRIFGRRRPAPPRAGRRPGSPPAILVSTAAAVCVAVVSAFTLVGGFRSSPWLDDAWGIWLPKGIALGEHGLDERLFVPNGEYVFFEVPDYPLWWSALTAFDVRLVGDVDVRAMNAQLALLAVAFLAAVARLLWGFVRPWLLWPALLMLTVSPEFLRQTQGGLADLPLAIYLALLSLCAALWLGTGSRFHLALAFPFASAALAIKTEGLPELIVLLVVLTLVALGPARARLPALLAVVGAALATHVPWLAWRAANGIEGRVSLTAALSPGHLFDRTERLGPSAEALAGHLFDPTEWLVIVPLALALALAGALRERRAAWLAVPAALAAGFVFWLWAYWADRDEINFVLATSAYRVVDPLVLGAAVFVPLLAERLLAREA
jgi:hypothetical protein